jgi:hypothetical protein
MSANTRSEEITNRRQAVVFINPTTKAYSVQDAREIYDAGYLQTDFIEFMREMQAGWPMLMLTAQLVDGDAHAELRT